MAIPGPCESSDAVRGVAVLEPLVRTQRQAGEVSPACQFERAREIHARAEVADVHCEGIAGSSSNPSGS